MLIAFMSYLVHLPNGSSATEHKSNSTVKRSDIVLFYFLLEQKLSKPKHSLRILVDCPIINPFLDLLQSFLISQVLMQMTLSLTLPVRSQRIEDRSISIDPSEC